MVIGAWLLASVLVTEKSSPSTTPATPATSETATVTTRLARGALCEAIVQAEEVAVSVSDDPRERLKQALTGLPEYAAALAAVAREAKAETTLSQDADTLAGIASATYDVASVLATLDAASSDEDYAAVLDEVKGLPLSSKSLGVSIPVLSAYALSGCQSRVGLLP